MPNSLVGRWSWDLLVVTTMGLVLHYICPNAAASAWPALVDALCELLRQAFRLGAARLTVVSTVLCHRWLRRADESEPTAVFLDHSPPLSIRPLGNDSPYHHSQAPRPQAPLPPLARQRSAVNRRPLHPFLPRQRSYSISYAIDRHHHPNFEPFSWTVYGRQAPRALPTVAPPLAPVDVDGCDAARPALRIFSYIVTLALVAVAIALSYHIRTITHQATPDMDSRASR